MKRIISDEKEMRREKFTNWERKKMWRIHIKDPFLINVLKQALF